MAQFLTIGCHLECAIETEPIIEELECKTRYTQFYCFEEIHFFSRVTKSSLRLATHPSYKVGRNPRPETDAQEMNTSQSGGLDRTEPIALITLTLSTVH